MAAVQQPLINAQVAVRYAALDRKVANGQVAVEGIALVVDHLMHRAHPAGIGIPAHQAFPGKPHPGPAAFVGIEQIGHGDPHDTRAEALFHILKSGQIAALQHVVRVHPHEVIPAALAEGKVARGAEIIHPFKII